MPAAAPLPGPLRCSAINHSTCARRASSEHCRVRAECCVSCGARLSRRRKQKHEQVIEPGALGSWRLGGAVRPYNSTCSPGAYTVYRRAFKPRIFILPSEDGRRVHPIGGSPTGQPRGPRSSAPRARRDASSIRDLERSLAKDAHCTGSMHRPPRQSALAARAVAADPRHVAPAGASPLPRRAPTGRRGPRPELELDARASPHVQQEHCKK